MRPAAQRTPLLHNGRGAGAAFWHLTAHMPPHSLSVSKRRLSCCTSKASINQGRMWLHVCMAGQARHA